MSLMSAFIHKSTLQLESATGRKLAMDPKKVINRLPRTLKNAMGLLIRYRIIYSKAFQKQYKELCKFELLPEEEKKRIQFGKLQDTLIYAYENCPYYKLIFDDVGVNPYSVSSYEELTKIPLLTKDIIRSKCNQLQSSKEHKYYYATSGGTSGTPVRIAFDINSLYKERAFVYHYWSKFGYDYKRSKLLSFREASYDGRVFQKNNMYNELQINPYLLDSIHIQEIVTVANSFGAEYLYGYPSTIAPFCYLINRNNLKLTQDISAIFLISENLYPDQIRQIRTVFQCPIVMFYGHTEKAVFAEQYDDVYYFNSLYGYVEITDEDESNIICTGFINKKMPLIRYKVDDKAVKRGAGYEIVGHREKEYLYGHNDYIVSATTLEFTHEDAFSKIVGYQFVQDVVGIVTMNIKSEENISNNELDEIMRIVSERLPFFTIDIKLVDQLQLTSRGKHKMIIQKLAHS